MQFRIDNASNRPVYQQIIDQVKRDIALGRLVKDEKLPTVRQLANQLAINPNTIAKAYQLLEINRVLLRATGGRLRHGMPCRYKLYFHSWWCA